MKNFITISIIAASFACGYLTKSAVSEDNTPRVTSIGGIFFKCKNPAVIREWYKTHLGLTMNKYGSVFEWRQADNPTKKGFSQWSPFPEKTKYFEPSQKDFMINYRVTDLEALVKKLKADGVTVTDEIESASYGKFVHIMDPEGNKIELWEPNDIEYEKLGSGTTTRAQRAN
jgi:predicted enzyme related to lactoylglutathione lyase